ncbi:MAG: family 10 glycosylhydrolase [Oscillospiraceae bacterium]|nr:family 10 glycosylhydrolase [Oscillospiraceae bacterium]
MKIYEKSNGNKNYNILLKRFLLLALAVSIGLLSGLPGLGEIIPAISLTLEVEAAELSDSRASIVGGGNELRGVWLPSIPVSSGGFPSKSGLSAERQKEEIDEIIKTCKEANLNAIFFQVRPAGDALYDSGLFPTSKYLVGTQGNSFAGGFDPLRYITEQAHANNIELHAWINPFRITNGSAGNPEHDVNALAASNPARKNPSWTVKYADGKLYYNPGLPEVRKLVADGAVEIIRKYNIDGIHFDDYFYPYPVSGAKFDDDAAYARYGAGLSLDDFRRENINKLIKEVYDAVKKENPSVRFGVSPFGIWANKSARAPTGSDTRGFEAYYSIYADAKSWIDGGYIDYICPQIYWAFDTGVARYDILVRWWSALVDGTGVDLYIGHAAYKLQTDFKSELEIPRQVEYGRAYMGVAGSVFFGYGDIKANSYKIKDNLAKLFSSVRVIPKPANTGRNIEVGRPRTGATVTDGSVNIMGSSNPAYPVYYDGQKIARTKSGFFTVYAPLSDGRNNINFRSNNLTHTHVVHKGPRSLAAPTPYVYPQMNSYRIEIITPVNDIITNPGDRVSVRVQAPSNSTVTAKLGSLTINLEALTIPPDEGTYMTEVYSGTFTLPSTQPQGEMIDLGNIVYSASRGRESASAEGINIRLINDSAYRPVEVIKDYTPFKIAIDSDSYNDYMFASIGMRDNVVSFRDGFYQLGCGGFIPATHAVLMPEKTLLINRILSAATENTGNITEIRFAVSENVPVDAVCRDGVFRVTLFNTPDGGRGMKLGDNPVFRAARVTSDRAKQTVTYSFDLIHADNWYGFELVYEGGFIVIKVKNPIRKTEGARPLEGMTIVVDAGHGGGDPGALGYLIHKNEKDLNLEIALALRTRLRNLGAEVVMTRAGDITLATPSARMEILNQINPDFMISVHHNSVGDAQDNTYVRGFESLYTNDSGRLLAKSVSRVVSSELNRLERSRSARYQAVGVLRNHKFPSTVLEMSFMTNPDEYEFANTAEGASRSADAIVSGVQAWIDDQQRWVK